MSLKDKTIVVTGGSRGLGLGLVAALVDQGAKVTVVARDRAALAAVKQRIGVVTISADVPRFARTSWYSTPAQPRAWVGWTS
jgi:NAD(P)-dependent dehydrogenase (short-subunit alcohol dehydrogenase family)